MNSELRIQPMTESDLDWVAEHERQLHAFPWTRGNFEDSLNANYPAIVLCEHDERVGYAVLLLVLDEAHLLNISIVREHQNRGLGRRFLALLFDLVRTEGATQLFLEVRPSNAAALALYRHIGFESIGRRKRYYPAVDGEREDALLMRIAL